MTEDAMAPQTELGSSRTADKTAPVPAAAELSDADLDRVAGGEIKQNPEKFINPDGTTNKSN
jgi:hypothetical protein